MYRMNNNPNNRSISGSPIGVSIKPISSSVGVSLQTSFFALFGPDVPGLYTVVEVERYEVVPTTGAYEEVERNS